MKTLAAISACALLALSTPSFSQSKPNTSYGRLQQHNGKVNAAGASHHKQSGSYDKESGPSNVVPEGRAAGTTDTPSDPAKQTPKMQGDQKKQDQAK